MVSTCTVREAVPNSKGHVSEEVFNSVVHRGEDSEERGMMYVAFQCSERCRTGSQEGGSAVRDLLKLLSIG